MNYIPRKILLNLFVLSVVIALFYALIQFDILSTQLPRTSRIHASSSTTCDNCRPIERHYQSWNSPQVALASFHGAGNTWTRHLIEQITGVYSGSVYHDKNLALIFPGELLPPNGSMSVIKTHSSNSLGRGFQKAIVIHRSYRESILSRFQYTRTNSNHSGKVSEEALLGEGWRKTAAGQTDKYAGFYTNWLKSFSGPLLLLRYRDMVSDLFPQLVRIRDFLQSDASDNHLRCVLCNREGSFHRQNNKAFDPWKYIPEDIANKAKEVDEYVENLINSNDRSNVFVGISLDQPSQFQSGRNKVFG